MATDDRRRLLFDALVRQRRVQRKRPQDEDVELVAEFLEHELGPTVSQRFAARCLGVSPSSLTRWTRSGYLPLVLTAGGQAKVPVTTLLEVYENVTEARAAGRRHVLEPKFLADGKAASELLPMELIADLPTERQGGGGHDRAELRALAYHRALASKLRRSDVDDARQTLRRWRRAGRIDERYASQWEQVLALPLTELRDAISDDSPHARDLRQSSPFAGRLSEAERRKILSTIR